MRALKTTLQPRKASPMAQDPRRSVLTELGKIMSAQALRLPLLIPLGLATGAVSYMSATNEPTWRFTSLIVLAALASTQISRIPRLNFLLWPSILALSIATGHLTAKIRTTMIAAPVLQQQIGPVRIEGRLVEIDSNDRSQRLRIAVRAIEGLPREETPAFARFSYRYNHNLVPGRAISCTAILSPPPQPIVPGDYKFHRDAWFRQLGAVGFAVKECVPRFASPPSRITDRISDRIAAIRRTIAEYVSTAAGAEGGPMAAALVAGDRSFISTEDSEALRQSGLAHLLAISGLHMALAGGTFFALIRFTWPFAEPLALRVPAVKAAALGAIIGCTLYFLLSGGSIATQRAFIMAMIAFSAKLLDKPALSLRSLAIAFAVIVLMNPEAVITPGFQMSFAASGALVAVYESWSRRQSDPDIPGKNRILNWTSGVIITSVTASLATTPFAIHHFDRTAILGIAANLMASPIISLWTAPSATGAMIASAFRLQDIFLASLGASLHAILFIAHKTQEFSPDVTAPPIGGGTLLWFAAAIATFCCLTGRGRWIAVAPLVMAIASWSTEHRPIGYVATNGAIYLRGAENWFEFSEWRKARALTPLALETDPLKMECDHERECLLSTPGSGAFVWLRSPKSGPKSTPKSKQSSGDHPCIRGANQLRYIDEAIDRLLLDECDLNFARGGVIESGKNGAIYHQGPKPSVRPWSNHAPQLSDLERSD